MRGSSHGEAGTAQLNRLAADPGVIRGLQYTATPRSKVDQPCTLSSAIRKANPPLRLIVAPLLAPYGGFALGTIWAPGSKTRTAGLTNTAV